MNGHGAVQGTDSAGPRGARALYFHNGFAATLLDVVEVNNLRFYIGLDAREKAELVAFLRAL